MHSEWEKGRRNLDTGSINALQTTPTNEMLSFHFSKFCLSQSQDSRREREFCPLNLEVRDENEIFLSISQGSRRDRDIFFQVSCFEMGLRDEINLILTRIFEIEKSRHALGGYPYPNFFAFASPVSPHFTHPDHDEISRSRKFS